MEETQKITVTLDQGWDYREFILQVVLECIKAHRSLVSAQRALRMSASCFNRRVAILRRRGLVLSSGAKKIEFNKFVDASTTEVKKKD